MKLLEINHLTKTFDNHTVVQDISLAIRKGESIGFLGPNGAGKSTTINMIATLLAKDKGDILLYGQPLTQQASHLKKHLGIVPQDIALFDDLSAYENVKFFCSLYGYRGSDLRDRVHHGLSSVGLYERRKDYPKSFSGGMKRRLNIACSIAHTPDLLIMDEPTVGIDPQSRHHILETIKALHRKGTAILYVSHYMEEVEALCDRIIIMDHGIILKDQSKTSLLDDYSKQLASPTLEQIFLELTGTDLRDEEVSHE